MQRADDYDKVFDEWLREANGEPNALQKQKQEELTNVDMVPKQEECPKTYRYGPYELSQDQYDAINNIIKFVFSRDNDDRAATLVGYPGTGKTFITKIIYNRVSASSKKIVLCAPTHRAKYVMSRMIGADATTLHSFLGLSPNLDIQRLDMRQLKFIIKDKKVSPPCDGLMIVDECSMINDEMFKFLSEFSREYKFKILYIGDAQQIKPVDSQHISKVFAIDRVYRLTTIHRQNEGSALLPYLIRLRDGIVNQFDTSESYRGSLYVKKDVQSFMKDIAVTMRAAVRDMDTDRCKVIAWHNKRVEMYNKYIRQIVFKDDKIFHPGEFLTGYDNFQYNDFKFYNSYDYVIVDEPRYDLIEVPHIERYYEGVVLNLYDKITNKTVPVKMIDMNKIESEEKAWFAEVIEQIRTEAVNSKFESERIKYWKMYYNITRCAAINEDLMFDQRVIRKKTFDYGYAITAHKSQGLTLLDTYIDMWDILQNRDELEKRQLQYVAMSRASRNCTILV